MPDVLIMDKMTASQALPRRAAQAGFSLVELMVSIVVGLVIVASLALLFANNSRARQEMEKTSQQIENGRYTVQTLRDDLRLAGYYGELSSIATASSVPDPSATDDATVAAALPIPVQGYHFGKNSSLYSTLPTGVSALLTNRRSNTDVIVVRRTSTCYAGPTNAESNCSSMDTSSSKYFQTSLCNTQLEGITDTTKWFVIGTDSNVFRSSNPNVSAYTPSHPFLTQADCATPAVTRAFYVRIYYVANDDVTGDGIPTLKMVSLGANSFGSPVAIAEGVEAIQYEYGIDDGASGGTAGDGQPDEWKSDPGAGLSASAAATAWSQVVAVKLHVLARNTQASNGQFTDSRQYVMGTTVSTDSTYGAYNDAYKRHVYTSVVRLMNVAGRRE